MKCITFRTFLAQYAGDPEVVFHQLDVESAYLTSNVRRTTYITLPARLRPKGHPTDSVYNLRKALYGGADSGRCYYDDYLQWHLDLGFTQIPHEPCYLKYECKNGTFIVICFYVDDAAYARKGDSLWAWYLEKLGDKYKYKLGPLDHFLGLRIRRMVNGDFHIDLESQVDRMLRTFELQDASYSKHPVHSNRPTSNDIPTLDEDIKAANRFPMMAAVGHLNYLQQMLEWSITYPLKVASKNVRDGSHGTVHHEWVKHIMKFLKSKSWSRYIIYAQPWSELILSAYTDADHIKAEDDRRSLSGHMILLGRTIIGWGATFQTIASHSSAESELMALDTCARKVVATIWLVEAMGCPKQPTVTIKVDCKPAISLAENFIPSSRSSHIHMRFFYVRQLNDELIIKLEHVNTKEQWADVLVTFKDKFNFDYIMTCSRGYNARLLLRDGEPATWIERRLAML